MSAVGTTPLQSPGWNEGKARNETLGKHGTQQLRAPIRSGTLPILGSYKDFPSES